MGGARLGSPVVQHTHTDAGFRMCSILFDLFEKVTFLKRIHFHYVCFCPPTPLRMATFRLPLVLQATGTYIYIYIYSSRSLPKQMSLTCGRKAFPFSLGEICRLPIQLGGLCQTTLVLLQWLELAAKLAELGQICMSFFRPDVGIFPHVTCSLHAKHTPSPPLEGRRKFCRSAPSLGQSRNP